MAPLWYGSQIAVVNQAGQIGVILSVLLSLVLEVYFIWVVCAFMCEIKAEQTNPAVPNGPGPGPPPAGEGQGQGEPVSSIE